MPSGTLQVYTALAENAAPLPGVTVLVLNDAGPQIARLTTNDVGSAPELVLTAPDEAYSLDEANTTVRPYAVYQLRAEMTGFQTIELEGVQVFAGQQTKRSQNTRCLPGTAAAARPPSASVPMPAC